VCSYSRLRVAGVPCRSVSSFVACSLWRFADSSSTRAKLEGQLASSPIATKDCFTPAGLTAIIVATHSFLIVHCTLSLSRSCRSLQFASILTYPSRLPWLARLSLHFFVNSILHTPHIKASPQGAGAGETCSALHFRNATNRSPAAQHVFFRHAFAPGASFQEERKLLRYPRPPCTPAPPQLCKQRQAQAFIRRRRHPPLF
jgi:hypothetical protein